MFPDLSLLVVLDFGANLKPTLFLICFYIGLILVLIAFESK